MAAVMTSDDVLAEDAGEASFELDAPPPVSHPPAPSSLNPGRVSGAMPRISGIPQEVSRPDIPITQQPARDPSRPDVRISKPPEVVEAPRIDPLEARAFADYGELPAGALQSPVYAFRVKMRQSELRRGLWRAKIAFERAQKDQSRALADPSRLDEVKSRLAADVEAKERDVDLHEAALLAFDAPSLKRGTQIAYAVCAVLFIAIFMPIFFRMCIGVDAPPLPQ